MDIIFKVRLAFWLLVLALWGTIVYQFIGGEAVEYGTPMQWVSNPFPRRTPSKPPPLQVSLPPAERPTKPITPQLPRLAKLPGVRPRPQETPLHRHEYIPKQQAPTPSGFYKSTTQHFIIFSEQEPAPQHLLDTLETLHANIMLDLAAFSPWAHDEQVSIFLFRTQDSYRSVTGRPPWSGGASSISKRKVYLYGSDEEIGILAHELCHIYFDSFFDKGYPDPLWLSEGMATLVQIERGLASPNWLPSNLDILYRGGGYHLYDLMKVENTVGSDDDAVRLWYTQSYSVVRFLIRSQWKSSFYRFCKYLRDGSNINDALARGYGMPFNRVKALEYAWRYDLHTHRLTASRNELP